MAWRAWLRSCLELLLREVSLKPATEMLKHLKTTERSHLRTGLDTAVLMGVYLVVHPTYPLVNIQKAIENGHL